MGEKRAGVMKEMEKFDMALLGERVSELWKGLSDEERHAFEEKARVAKESHEKAMLEYENRADVKEASAKAKYDKLKSEVAKARRDVAKAQAHFEKLGNELAAAKSEWEHIKRQNMEPRKPNKRTAASMSSTSKDAKRVRVLEPALLKKAGELEVALRNLASRPEMADKTGEEMLKALRANGGLVNKPKTTLM